MIQLGINLSNEIYFSKIRFLSSNSFFCSYEKKKKEFHDVDGGYMKYRLKCSLVTFIFVMVKIVNKCFTVYEFKYSEN